MGSPRFRRTLGLELLPAILKSASICTTNANSEIDKLLELDKFVTVHAPVSSGGGGLVVKECGNGFDEGVEGVA